MRRVFRLPPGKASIARELDEELAFHIETRTQRLIAAGMTPEEAYAEALRQFGDIDAVRYDCLILDHDRERAMRRANIIDEMRQDIGYAFRALRHNRGFAATVVLTLALGLGVNMAMFAFLDVVFLRPPAGVAAPEQVRRVWTEIKFTNGAQFWSTFSYAQYAAVKSSLGIYSTIAYMVAQRTHEFGVRSALGARTSDILRQVISSSLRTAAIGVAVGIVLAILGGRFVAALLYGIEPGDPAIMGGVAIALLVVAAAAALGPAWRAARVDPVTALRVD